VEVLEEDLVLMAGRDLGVRRREAYNSMLNSESRHTGRHPVFYTSYETQEEMVVHSYQV